MSVVIETTLGDITVDLYLSERPRACLNFLKLCKLKYYNYNLFHTISRGFIAQTGDPTGSRTGGESFFGVLDGPEKRYFEAENEPRIKHTRPGLISFVGGTDNMIGSQFFLTLGEDLTYLDEKHCVFGEVVEGFEILEAVNEVICDKDDRPYQDVRITHTVVLDDPFPDPKGLRAPSRSPSPSAERLAGGRIAPDEEIDETSGRSAKEIAEMQAEREAKARATILEMVGDIPDADMAPPENVLFVCKLNPVTTDDDLEIIFSRFGKINSCEVIRDRKSGESLQYAFIEFDEQKSCEDAYFKMANVLIDDRRIHVDFSQSVSKVKWLGKGRGVKVYGEKNNKNDIGKGNYKDRNGAKEENGEARRDRKPQSRSPIRNRRSRESPIRNRRSRESPRRERRNNSPQYRRKQRSPSPIRNRRKSRSPERRRRYSRSPVLRRRTNDSRRQEYNRSSRKSPYTRRSRSPRRRESSNRKSLSPYRRRRSRSIKRNENLSRERSKSRDMNKISDRNGSTKKIEKPKEDIRKSRDSRSPKNVVKKSQRDELMPSTTSELLKRDKSDSPKRSPKEKFVSTKEVPKKKEEVRKEEVKISKQKRTKSSSEESESETESEDEKPKKKKHKTVDTSTESSSEEEVKKKSKKRKSKMKGKKKKKTKKRKKKYSSSSDTSSSESSSSESSSSSDNRRKRKNKKKKRTKRSSSSSD